MDKRPVRLTTGSRAARDELAMNLAPGWGLRLFTRILAYQAYLSKDKGLCNPKESPISFPESAAGADQVDHENSHHLLPPVKLSAKGFRTGSRAQG
jgi:hypothetical protein